MVFINMNRVKIKSRVRYLLNESVNQTINIEQFPSDIIKTLEEYRSFFVERFDWNDKADEMGENMNTWLKQHESEGFIKNIDKVIKVTTQDLILIKRQDMSKRKLDAFEELIKPTLGNSVLVPILTKFEASVIMDPNASIESINKGFKEAKNIIDKHGNLDYDKIEQSSVLTGGDINIPNFERFVGENPEYKGVYDDWKKLEEEETELFLTQLNAWRNSTSIERIRNLRNFLIDFKKNKI